MKKTICDFCGKEFDLWDTQEDFGFSYRVGYGSKFDECDIDVDLCTDCFDKMMDEYILPRCQNKVVKIPDDR